MSRGQHRSFNIIEVYQVVDGNRRQSPAGTCMYWTKLDIYIHRVPGSSAVKSRKRTIVLSRSTLPGTCTCTSIILVVLLDGTMDSFVFLGLCIVSTVASSVPKWEPTYNMSLSTIFMPCNFSGYTDAALAAKFGIVDFDCKSSRSAAPAPSCRRFRTLTPLHSHSLACHVLPAQGRTPRHCGQTRSPWTAKSGSWSRREG